MRVRLLDGHLLGAQTSPPADAIDVRVHGEGWHVEREAQHNGGSLWADAVELRQSGTRFVDWHMS